MVFVRERALKARPDKGVPVGIERLSPVTIFLRAFTAGLLFKGSLRFRFISRGSAINVGSQSA